MNSLRQRLVRLILISLSFTSTAAALSIHSVGVRDFWYLIYSPVIIAALSFGLRGALLGSAAAIAAATLLLHRAQGAPLLTVDLVYGYVYTVLAAGLGNLAVAALACWVGWQQDQQRARQRTIERFATELAAERSWLQTVIRHSPVGILLVEGNRGERIQANAYIERLFGHPLRPEAGLAQCLESLHSPDGRTLSPQELDAVFALEGEGTLGHELLIHQDDETEVPVLVSAVRLGTSTAKGARIVVVIEDISLAKQLERQREEWTSLVAHDLRQPITVIASYAELAAVEGADLLNPIQTEAIDQIRTSATRLERMVADLLDASRIEARRMTMERETVDLPVLLHSIVDRNAPSLRDHHIALNIEEGLPPLEADPHRLEQVLSNLLSNAAKYGHAGTEIELRARADSAEVEISVSNQGDGIPPDELPQLFGRFRRAKGAREKKIAGIGLGLYIVRGLVEAHGGRIWADSTLGHTTAFYFTLPVSGTPSDGTTSSPKAAAGV